MDTFPIIRLELQNMKQSLQVMLNDYQATLDDDIKEAVDNFCTEKNIKRIITETVEGCISGIIKEEVERFYRYGKGREIVKELVMKILEEREE